MIDSSGLLAIVEDGAAPSAAQRGTVVTAKQTGPDGNGASRARSVWWAGDLVAYLREHTPERAAVPVALHFVDPMPLTAVGKIFKPALRVDAIRRVAEQLLEGVSAGSAPLVVLVVPDAKHGQLVRVSLGSTHGSARERLTAAVHDRLGPLTIRHEVV